jgi:hypothetical protein
MQGRKLVTILFFSKFHQISTGKNDINLYKGIFMWKRWLEYAKFEKENLIIIFYDKNQYLAKNIKGF